MEAAAQTFSAEPSTGLQCSGKCIVVCFDGTCNEGESSDTNVWRLFRIVAVNDMSAEVVEEPGILYYREQVKHYIRGVGTGGRSVEGAAWGHGA